MRIEDACLSEESVEKESKESNPVTMICLIIGAIVGWNTYQLNVIQTDLAKQRYEDEKAERNRRHFDVTYYKDFVEVVVTTTDKDSVATTDRDGIKTTERFNMTNDGWKKTLAGLRKNPSMPRP
jgi:hypothetical protein